MFKSNCRWLAINCQMILLDLIDKLIILYETIHPDRLNIRVSTNETAVGRNISWWTVLRIGCVNIWTRTISELLQMWPKSTTRCCDQYTAVLGSLTVLYSGEILVLWRPWKWPWDLHLNSWVAPRSILVLTEFFVESQGYGDVIFFKKNTWDKLLIKCKMYMKLDQNGGGGGGGEAWMKHGLSERINALGELCLLYTVQACWEPVWYSS